MAGTGPTQGQFGDINITPLTDVFLVLLVVIIIAAPSTQSLQKDISTPKLQQGETLNKDWPMVEVTAQDTIMVDGKQVTVDQLRADGGLFDQWLADPVKQKSLVVRGDQTTASGVILEILEAATAEGFEKTYIAGELEKLANEGIR